MKKIAIIGGGLAGLSAGVNGQKEGFETVIYEKNSYIGGCCYSWKRGGYVMDNCIHWLLGTKEGTNQRKMWEELGALDESSEIYERSNFYSSTLNGQSVTLWRDLEKTRKELIELSPEDANEINIFIDCTEKSRSLVNTAEDFMDFKSLFTSGELSVPGSSLMRQMFRYFKTSLADWAAAFKHPLLQKMITDFSAKEYEAFWLIISYAMFTTGDADVPVGGSGAMTKRIAQNYERLGGKIEYGKKAVGIEFAEGEIALEGKKAVKILFDDGTDAEADYIICACPPSYTFTKLLDEKYAPMGFMKMINEKKIPVYSSFHAAFAVDGEMEEVNDLLYFPCDAFDVGSVIYDRIGVKNYRKYGSYVAPEGKSVIQCSFIQYPVDFEMWTALRDNKKQYDAKKKYICDAVLERLEEQFPEYKGKIHYIDSWTPATYGRYLGSDRGMYMRYITTPLKATAFFGQDVSGLSNVFLASHVLMYPGGTPIAAIMGKQAVEKIKNTESSILNKINIQVPFIKQKSENEDQNNSDN